MTEKCIYCDMIHGPTCPRITAIECYPDGTMKRVEFFIPQPVQFLAPIPREFIPLPPVTT